MEDVITVSANLATKGFEKGSKAMKQAVNSLSSSARRMGQVVGQGANMALSSVRRLVPMLLGVSSAYGVISKAVSAFMSQNQKLSSKMSSIWTALGNILGPVITQVINWITTAVSYFIEFLRLLGITSKTASEASKKAQGAGGALQKTIAGFDELNMLNDSGGGGGGAGLDDPDKFPEWLDGLIEALKSKEWERAKDIIVQKINGLIEVAKGKAKEFGEKFANEFAGALQIIGGVLDEVNFKGIGETIANFFNGLFSEVDGESIGQILVAKFQIIFSMLDGFLETIDGTKFGNILSGIISGAAKSLDDAIKEADFAKIGANIADFVNGVDWPTVGTELATLLTDIVSGALTALTTFISGVDATEIGKGIANFFNGIDLETLAADLEALLETAFTKGIDLLSTAITGIDWQKIGAAIKTFFANIDWEDVKNQIFRLLEAAWTAVCDLLWGVIAGDSEEEPPLVGSIRQLGEKVLEFAQETLPVLKDVWDNVILPILPVVIDNLTAIIGFIGDVITKVGEFAVAHPELTIDLVKGALGLLIAVDVAKWADGIIGSFKNIIGLLGGAGAGGSGGGGLIAGISGLIEALGGIAVVGPIAAVGAIGVGVAIADSNEKTERWNAMAEKAGGTTEGWINVINDLSGKLEQQNADLESLSACGADLTMQYDAISWTERELAHASDELVASLGIEDEQVKGLTYSYFLQKASVEDLKKQQELGYPVKKRLATAEEKLSKLTEKYNEVLAQQGLALDEQTGTIIRVAEAVTGEAEAMTTGAEQTQVAADKVAELQNASEGTTTATEDLGTASQDTAGDTQEMAQEIEEAKGKIDELKTAVHDASDSMSKDFITAMTDMKAAATDNMPLIESEIESGFGSVISSAYSWGVDLIINFNNGLVDAMNNVLVPTMQNIAQAIKDYLGFSEPKKGPLSNFHTFGPDMMELYSEGIKGASNRVLDAVSGVADGVADRFSDSDFSIGINPALSALNAVPFQMPVVAGGGILPYSVDSSGLSGPGSQRDSEMLNAIMELRELIEDFRYSVENMQWIAKFGNVRAVVEEITKIQKKIERSGG